MKYIFSLFLVLILMNKNKAAVTFFSPPPSCNLVFSVCVRASNFLLVIGPESREKARARVQIAKEREKTRSAADQHRRRPRALSSGSAFFHGPIILLCLLMCVRACARRPRRESERESLAASSFLTKIPAAPPTIHQRQKL